MTAVALASGVTGANGVTLDEEPNISSLSFDQRQQTQSDKAEEESKRNLLLTPSSNGGLHTPTKGKNNVRVKSQQNGSPMSIKQKSVLPAPEGKIDNGITSSEESSTLRRSQTMPSPSPSTVSASTHTSKLQRAYRSDTGVTPSSHSVKLDRFGFIINMDTNGVIRASAEETKHSAPNAAELKRTQRRIEKWNIMMASWATTPKRLILRRVRKGIPDSQRGAAWPLLGDVEVKLKKHPGLYQRLVRESIANTSKLNETEDSTATSPERKNMKSFKIIQETIERDIHRTFPRHSMFYEDVNRTYDDASEVDNNTFVEEEEEILEVRGALCPGATEEISEMIKNLDGIKSSLFEHSDALNNSEAIMQEKGGQAALRRVLKAYSLFDREIGYCQGMNFIAGMFLTQVSEEESFWLLVAVMYDLPCQMRGLFGEGMRETHKVLYVAEKLIRKFLPKLARHFDKEHIQITMFATQWLLTQYTSSFRFDLVTRVWDCFLLEGWKITYRVMLSLLSRWESRLLKMSFEEILTCFRELPDHTEGGSIVDAAIKIRLRRSHIKRFEKEWQTQQKN